jgi:hypothetical protein
LALRRFHLPGKPRTGDQWLSVLFELRHQPRLLVVGSSSCTISHPHSISWLVSPLGIE